ncbi:MAG TPA: flagellar hook protein FlgE [Bryobacteraceae bacterium]|jgi:flagellar hook protein FlgE|nr:flagellar hook protein FlgE [Bryobacteraceae bacterium]
MSSFYTALSGLQASTTALDVVGNNLANMNTQGFKSDDILFEDAMNEATSSLQVGAGVGQTITNTDFTQGNITNTAQPLNLAIQGNGFFVVQNSTGQMLYTRDGNFSLNSQGQLVDANGDQVQGWMATDGTVNPSGATAGITVPLLTSLPPVATQNMSLTANLDSSAAVGTTFSTPIQVYDSLGNAQTLTVTFTNTAAGAWSYAVQIPGQDLQGGTAGTMTSLATGNLAFNSSGQLTSPAAGAPVTVTNGTALADGAATLNINWNLYDANNNPTITDYAETSASSGTTQDGSAAATVTGVSLTNGGLMVANYSNGTQQDLAQVALAAVSNPNTMIATANNDFTLGPGTITPSVGAAGTGARGDLVGESLEASNVDMATQFTDLIVYQESYEANSKVLTTVDQMDQALLAINP